MNFLKGIILYFLVLVIFPCSVIAAEVLQVKSSDLLQIGDQNRNYTVKIGCVTIEPTLELKAKNWLKIELPRKSKVNLRPISSVDGILIAHVIPIGQNKDLSLQMIENGFAINTCN